MSKRKYTRYIRKSRKQKYSLQLVFIAVLSLTLLAILILYFADGLEYIISPFSSSPVDNPLEPVPALKNEVSEAPVLNLVPKAQSLPEPTPTPDLSKLFVNDQDVYTIGWVSDTQHYAGKYPELYSLLTEFLAKEQANLNLKYIVHTGDLVHNSKVLDEWDVANKAMQALSNLPYGVLAGNHDIGRELDFTNYSRNFGEDAMRARTNNSYYGGSYKNNRGHYDLIRLGSRQFVFVYMSYSPDSQCIRWVNKVFEDYREYVGVLCVHDYFDTDMSYSTQGKLLFDKVVKKNPNIYLVMCGHRYTIGHAKITINDGNDKQKRTVYELISNYQSAGPKGGSAYMQFLQVDEGKGEVRVISYSPYTDDYNYHDTPGAELEKYPVNPKNEEYKFPIPWGF